MHPKRNSTRKSSGIKFVKPYDGFSDSNRLRLEEQIKYEIAHSVREQYLCDVFLGTGVGFAISDLIVAYRLSPSLKDSFSETSGYFALGVIVSLIGAYFRNYFKARREECELRFASSIKKE